MLLLHMLTPLEVLTSALTHAWSRWAAGWLVNVTLLPLLQSWAQLDFLFLTLFSPSPQTTAKTLMSGLWESSLCGCTCNLLSGWSVWWESLNCSVTSPYLQLWRRLFLYLDFDLQTLTYVCFKCFKYKTYEIGRMWNFWLQYLWRFALYSQHFNNQRWNHSFRQSTSFTGGTVSSFLKN